MESRWFEIEVIGKRTTKTCFLKRDKFYVAFRLPGADPETMEHKVDFAQYSLCQIGKSVKMMLYSENGVTWSPYQ